MFRDTIRRNLLWANPQASDAEIWDALAIAGVDNFVAGLLDLKPRPTIVMIAHRDQSLASCDPCSALQDGRAIADEPALTG